jgi:hypothetical protein
MKRIFLIILAILSFGVIISAQNYKPVTVLAGMRVIDCFPISERFKYPEFLPGHILLKSGVYSDCLLNYNILGAEIQFLRGKDTLAIASKKDIRYVSVGTDTFYVDKGSFFGQVNGLKVKLYIKEYMKLKESQKQDSYGTTSAGSASTSYSSFSAPGNFYKLTANTDMVFQRTLEYYISDREGGYASCSKKNVLQIYPDKKDEIKSFLKSSGISFDNYDDLIKLCEFLSGLK